MVSFGVFGQSDFANILALNSSVLELSFILAFCIGCSDAFDISSDLIEIKNKNFFCTIHVFFNSTVEHDTQRSAFAKYREFIAGPAQPTSLNWERKFAIKAKD